MYPKNQEKLTFFCFLLVFSNIHAVMVLFQEEGILAYFQLSL